MSIGKMIIFMENQRFEKRGRCFSETVENFLELISQRKILVTLSKNHFLLLYLI